jgi:hypothetical protein
LPSPRKTRGSPLHKNKTKQHTYIINHMKITSTRNQTRIVVVSPGVNDDDDGAAQKQQPTGERRRRAVHCATKQQAGSARSRRGCCTVRRAPCAHREGAREGALRRAAVFWIGGLGAGTWTPWLQEQRCFAEELRSEGKGEARCKGAARPWRCGRGEQRLGRPAASSRAGNKCGLPEAGSRLVFHGR